MYEEHQHFSLAVACTCQVIPSAEPDRLYKASDRFEFGGDVAKEASEKQPCGKFQPTDSIMRLSTADFYVFWKNAYQTKVLDASNVTVERRG